MSTVTINDLPAGTILSTDPLPFWSASGSSTQKTTAAALVAAAGGAGGGITYATVAALRLGTVAYASVVLEGYNTVGDGGGGVFYRVAGSGAADNGGTIFVDASGNRYFRLFDGPIFSSWFGTYGDFSHDDTAALQATINFGLAHNLNVQVPAGVFKITAGLTVTPPNDMRFFRFSGAGMGTDFTGTEFRLVGTGINAIMQLNPGAHLIRNFEWTDFALTTQSAAGATYGLLFASTEYSFNQVRRVFVNRADGGGATGPSVAYGILGGTGANGEFTLYESCVGGNIDTFFYSNAGQAFQQRFDHCTAGVNAGGTYFHMAITGGGGLYVTDLNGTSSTVSGISNSLLLQDDGDTSTVKFSGGRLEHITQVYANLSTTGGTTVVFESMELTIDYDPTNGALTRTAVVNHVNTGGVLTFRDMQFSGEFANTSTFPVKQQHGNAQQNEILFDNCLFQNFTRVPYGTDLAGNLNQGLKYINCRTSIGTGGNSQNMVAFDRQINSGEFTPGKRSVDGDHAWMPAGRPDQQIVNPQIANTNGNAVTPLAPWVASGTGTIVINDWNAASNAPNNSSPFARRLTLVPNQSLSQTLTAIDLSTTAVARYNMNGTIFSLLTWQIFVHEINGSAGNNPANNITFTLSESLGGTVLDSIEYAIGSSAEYPKVITLSAPFVKASASTFPVLTMTAGTAGNLFLGLDWQYFSTYLKPAFNPVTSAQTYSQDFSGTMEDLLVWDRLALPHKSDSYGATATNALPNEVSDIYTSSTDERVTYQANAKWWKIPRAVQGTAIPVAGTWALGDQVINSNPSSLAPYGWVCTAAGTPGTWLGISSIGVVAPAYGTVPPVAGAHVIADQVLNSAPALGAPLGWVCTASGTPGTWQPFGLVDPKAAVDINLVNFNTALIAQSDYRVVCTRASSGNFYAKTTGYLTSAANNVARYDFDPITHAANGVLVETAATNLILQSNTFGTTWTTTGTVTVTAAATASPDNTINASALLENAITTNAYGITQATITFANSTTYTMSIYAKFRDYQWLLLEFDMAVNTPLAYFDLVNGVASNVGAGVTAKIQAVANGFYRCSISYTSSGADGTAAGVVKVQWTNTAGTASHTGVVGKGVYAFGAMLAAEQTASSYVATTTVAVTRVADTMAVASTSCDSVNPTCGTLVLDVGMPFLTTVSNTQSVLFFSDVAGSNASISYQSGAGAIIRDGISNISLGAAGVIIVGANKWGLSWNGQSGSGTSNGATPVTVTPWNPPWFVGGTNILFGNNSTHATPGMWLRRLRLWNYDLDPTTLQYLTTSGAP